MASDNMYVCCVGGGGPDQTLDGREQRQASLECLEAMLQQPLCLEQVCCLSTIHRACACSAPPRRRSQGALVDLNFRSSKKKLRHVCLDEMTPFHTFPKKKLANRDVPSENSETHRFYIVFEDFLWGSRYCLGHLWKRSIYPVFGLLFTSYLF